MIDMRNVSVELGGKQILDNVCLAAIAGKFSAVVGPNGSGKTTLLRTLTGELDYDGKIEINGNNLRVLRPQDQANLRGVLPQSSIVSFPFTVREVVLLGSAIHSPLNARDCEVSAVLEQVGLNGFSGRRYSELSGGEQQRVQLARVLLSVGKPVSDKGPKWLFLDEPVSSLDIRHQLQIMNIARAFAKQGGGVIAVMHDLNLTALYSDTIFMMNSGTISAQGSPKEVLTSENVSRIFDCDLVVGHVPLDSTPFVLPHSAQL